MASSCCKAQLSLWHEIISKCNEKTTPEDQHVKFIQKRFDELDSKGFTWSKESILDIFLQLGLSESPDVTSSSVNDLPESRVGQENEISFDVLTEVIQNVELEHKSRPMGLLDLPIEVFHKVLEQLNCMAGLEDGQNYMKKHLAKVIITGPGDRKPYTTYLHQNSPILNSIQAFSLTSREIYNRCEPWLWRKLSFPTALPAPIDLWTKDILLRRGSHTKFHLQNLFREIRLEAANIENYGEQITVNISSHIENYGEHFLCRSFTTMTNMDVVPGSSWVPLPILARMDVGILGNHISNQASSQKGILLDVDKAFQLITTSI
ncbi:uncharacterized protein MELLADRAFT_102154 [Melampsora larici-populina 98AG31]|uniref:Uncharacterized protein n=1 Tax=Melampsora larici-populina (strain 98AG31 / pathotype 3-4-7) TaxID=747676 RepID=F4R7D4_MELLP|nr:uncharacterized protein MELLADRAFT_102154 [Melampsora larici-populina 98AG31]EGG11805.1 hypothetical protein MELLADRAFT_102154 [Melampsora larici-populina 98AG31]